MFLKTRQAELIYIWGIASVGPWIIASCSWQDATLFQVRKSLLDLEQGPSESTRPPSPPFIRTTPWHSFAKGAKLINIDKPRPGLHLTDEQRPPLR